MPIGADGEYLDEGRFFWSAHAYVANSPARPVGPMVADYPLRPCFKCLKTALRAATARLAGVGGGLQVRLVYGPQNAVEYVAYMQHTRGSFESLR